MQKIDEILSLDCNLYSLFDICVVERSFNFEEKCDYK